MVLSQNWLLQLLKPILTPEEQNVNIYFFDIDYFFLILSTQIQVEYKIGQF